jgi:3-deoxy-manno-octulosonate cytidylyltransferase (CMP-KDO synthetase)
VQQSFVRKILGLIAYRKDFLLHLTSLPASLIERAEFIEQMRILEHGYLLRSVPVSPSLPSVNEPGEADIVLDYIRRNADQQALLNKILKQ